MKRYLYHRLALCLALALMSGAAPASDAPVEVTSSAMMADNWWAPYQYNQGFNEALSQLGLSVEQLNKENTLTAARSTEVNDPLFWLKRTLTVYPANAPDHYNIPVTESNNVMRARTTTFDRNNYFLTREYGKAGEVLTIKAGTIPAGVICYAAMDGDMTLFKGTGSEKALVSDGTSAYMMPHDGILLLGCKDNNNHLHNLDTFVPMQIVSGGSQRHPLFIFGLHSRHDWVDFTQQTMPTGYGVFFDGRTRYAVSQKKLAASVNSDMVKTLRENLLRTLTYDKLNGMDGSTDLHQPARSLFMTSYDACCWANSAGGRVAIGQHQTLPSLGNWATWHEYGHQYQMGWSWKEVQEVTVNLYSLAACYTEWGYGALNECHPQFPSLGFSWDQQAVGDWVKAGQSGDIDADRDHFRRLNMFAQLLASYPDLYPALGKAYREAYNRGENRAALDTKQEKIDWFAIHTSRLSGHDLREFFTLWNLPYSAVADEKIGAMRLPAPPQPLLTYESPLIHSGHAPTTARLTIDDNVDKKGIGFIANSKNIGPRSLVWSGKQESRLYTQVVDTENRAYTVALRGKRSMGGCAGHGVNTAALCGSGTRVHLSVSYHQEDNPDLPPGEYHGTLPLIATAWKKPEWSANVNIPLIIYK